MRYKITRIQRKGTVVRIMEISQVYRRGFASPAAAERFVVARRKELFDRNFA